VKQFIIQISANATNALERLNAMINSESMTLFVLDRGKLIGTITDGDIRRGILKGKKIDDPIKYFINSNFKYLKKDQKDVKAIKEYKNMGVKLIPVLDDQGKLSEILDLTKYYTKIPASVLLMAGGLGSRLRPLTDNTPKPMLIVGDKPIIEHNIDRLIKFGITDFYVSVKYLKDQIIDYLGDGKNKGIKITYIEEDEPLGTLGAISKIKKINQDSILVMNSDLLTDLDFESFYIEFIQSSVKMMVVSIPYDVNIPYAVLGTKENQVINFIEKPTYTYYCNGGIYFLNFSEKSKIPKNTFFNATDLMEKLTKENELAHFIHKGFWLDIGKPKDFEKSQNYIKHLKL
jgi:dTDP-glucose pyrophosphorylase